MRRCLVSPDLPFQVRRNDARLITQRVRAFLNLLLDFVEDALRSRLDFLVLLLRGGLELFTAFGALCYITRESPPRKRFILQEHAAAVGATQTQSSVGGTWQAKRR